jgi:hypothetical protein
MYKRTFKTLLAVSIIGAAIPSRPRWASPRPIRAPRGRQKVDAADRQRKVAGLNHQVQRTAPIVSGTLDPWQQNLNARAKYAQGERSLGVEPVRPPIAPRQWADDGRPVPDRLRRRHWRIRLSRRGNRSCLRLRHHVPRGRKRGDDPAAPRAARPLTERVQNSKRPLRAASSIIRRKAAAGRSAAQRLLALAVPANPPTRQCPFCGRSIKPKLARSACAKRSATNGSEMRPRGCRATVISPAVQTRCVTAALTRSRQRAHSGKSGS